MCPAEGEEIVIVADVTSNLFGTLTWNTGVTDVYQISATDTLVYFASFEDSNGCFGSDTIKVFGACVPPDPVLPNILTNDSPWRPIGNIYPEQFIKSSFVVLNRWGLVVYETKEILPEWDGINKNGLPSSAGVYYWIWEFEDNTYDTRTYNGFMQVVR